MNCKVMNRNSGVRLLEIVSGIAIILALRAGVSAYRPLLELYALDSATQMLSSNGNWLVTLRSQENTTHYQFYGVSWYDF
jgi:hypothetical protein